MKKLRLTIAAAVIAALTLYAFAGCTDTKEIMNDYIALISQEAEDSEALDGILAEAEVYISSNIKKLEEEDADYMLYLYIDKAGILLNEDADKFGSLIDDYGKYLSDTMNDILAIELAELEEPLPDFTDANGYNEEAFWRMAMGRALAVEETVNKHKDVLLGAGYEYIKPEIVWYYKYYINYMLIGSPDKLLFDNETHMFSDDARSAYVELAQQNPDSTAAYAVNEFFNYLDSIGYELDLRDADSGKIYYDTCKYIVEEAGKRLYQQEAQESAE